MLEEVHASGFCESSILGFSWAIVPAACMLNSSFLQKLLPRNL